MKLSELLLPLSGFNLEIASPNSFSSTGEASDKISSADRIHQQLEMTGVSADSTTVKPGQVFVAIQGGRHDGHDQIPQALSRGASFIIVQDPQKVPPGLDSHRWMRVPSSRRALSLLAHQFYGNPTMGLLTIGVTGTNGKTSSTYLLEHLLKAQGMQTGVMGTINHHLGDHIWPTQLTTSDPVLMASRMKEFRDHGARAAVLEVSSHALDQRRCDGVRFNGAIFTNLTRDHLDYHHSMPEYFAAKQKLFSELLHENLKTNKAAAVNIDDPWGRKMNIAPEAELVTFGQVPEADFSFEILRQDINGTSFVVKTARTSTISLLPMCGAHNVYNAVGSVAVLSRLGIAPEENLLESLASFPGVPGRLEKMTSAKGFHVFVDYAHTPDALEKALETLRPLTRGRLVTVFGCGGDRDVGKRPLMTKIAAERSNVAILTSDNPRTENPEAILEQMLKGVSVPAGCEIRNIVDRKKAIASALSDAKADDVILIAGKGHEDYQIIGTEKFPFDDRIVAKEFL